MQTVAAKNMLIGQTEKLHLKLYMADGVTPDLTTALVLTPGGGGTAAVDPNDNRAVIVTATTAGGFALLVDTSPALPGAGVLQVTLTVSAPPPDLRRVDLLTADDPQ